MNSVPCVVKHGEGDQRLQDLVAVRRVRVESEEEEFKRTLIRFDLLF